MDYFNVIIGIVLIVSGYFINVFYDRMVRKHGSGGLSFKLRTGGIGFIIIGIYLILSELLSI